MSEYLQGPCQEKERNGKGINRRRGGETFLEKCPMFLPLRFLFKGFWPYRPSVHPLPCTGALPNPRTNTWGQYPSGQRKAGCTAPAHKRMGGLPFTVRWGSTKREQFSLMERPCYRKWLTLFSLKFQRDNRKKGLSRRSRQGENRKKAVFSTALWR